MSNGFEIERKRLTVSELTRIIKRLVEENIPVVTIEGEISNYTHHASGHRYFTLKDEISQAKQDLISGAITVDGVLAAP